MLAFDHLVVAAPDPEDARKQFTKTTQLTGVPGGHHSNWGTHNQLCYFSKNSYIEWIGIENNSQAETTTNPLIRNLKYSLDHDITGPIQFGLRTDNMDEYIRHLTEQGINFQGPYHGERKKQDGSLLKWRMLFPTAQSVSSLPFLIEWEGENLPEDLSCINEQEFTEIVTGVDDLDQAVPLFRKIYQFGPPHVTEDQMGNTAYQWALAHGLLTLNEGNQVHACFNPIFI
ncbi:VOC family protein [Halobacillus rhizosphaerae]|uniref:VOC family protein n=1 Tax=Halobacillus rhizosphaerae TaxID=3064889 RepID=UPI00398A82E9